MEKSNKKMNNLELAITCLAIVTPLIVGVMWVSFIIVAAIL